MVALAAATVLVLKTSLERLLVEQCRSENHGRFWFAFAAVATVLTSLFGALLAFRFGALTAWDQTSALEIVATSFRAGLLGPLVCLGFVALGLVASIGLGAPGLGAPNIEPPHVKS